MLIIKKGANYGYCCAKGRRRSAGDDPGPGGRHDSVANHGHGHARHGQADLSGDRLPAYQHRGRNCRRLHLSRQADSGAQGQAAVRRHHHGPDLVRRDEGRTERGRRQPRRRSRRSTSSTQDFGVSSNRRSARGGRGDALPGAALSGTGARGRALRGGRRRRAYLPTKSDGTIRRWWASSKGCPRRAAPAIAPHAGP